MTETAETKPRKKGMLIPIAATLILGGVGFGSTYLGLWSPAAMLSRPAEAKVAHGEMQAEFVDIPTIEIVMPGGRSRSLILSATIESDSAHKAQVQHLMPRVSDAFTTFLSGVDPSAYEKRGVLEIIRTELFARTRLVLGDGAVTDLLITEFRFK